MKNNDNEMKENIRHLKETFDRFEHLLNNCSERIGVLEKDKEESKIKEAYDFQCSLCNFASNREGGLQIHLSRKHMIKPEDDIDTDFDSEIEEYLSSGVMGTDPQLWEDILFYLKSRDEKLLALECRKRALDEQFGTGYYLDQYPWILDRDLRNTVLK